MNGSRRGFRLMPRLLLTSVALGVGVNEVHAVGGGHGGGGHGGGGGHVGAYHGGYGHGGYGNGRGYYGGYYGGYGFYGYPYGFGFGLGYGFGYGYGSGYGGYNNYGYPYYGSGYGYPYFAGTPGYYGGAASPGPNPYYATVFPYGNVNSAYGTSGPPPGGSLSPGQVILPGSPSSAARSPDTEVALVVRVPASATVWVNGVKTTQNGPRREFASGGLNPGRNYTFVVRARWIESDGNVVDNDRRITVQAGERRAIDFGALPSDAATASPAPIVISP